MRHRLIIDKERNLLWLILGISGISILAWFGNTYPPDTMVKIATALLLFFTMISSMSYFLLNNVRHALLLSLGLSIFLILRILQLREPIYPILLLVSVLSLELLFQNK